MRIDMKKIMSMADFISQELNKMRQYQDLAKEL